eukprot:6175466-Pleurochrysis_carterae.AAC.3
MLRVCFGVKQLAGICHRAEADGHAVACVLAVSKPWGKGGGQAAHCICETWRCGKTDRCIRGRME